MFFIFILPGDGSTFMTVLTLSRHPHEVPTLPYLCCTHPKGSGARLCTRSSPAPPATSVKERSSSTSRLCRHFGHSQAAASEHPLESEANTGPSFTPSLHSPASPVPTERPRHSLPLCLSVQSVAARSRPSSICRIRASLGEQLEYRTAVTLVTLVHPLESDSD